MFDFEILNYYKIPQVQLCNFLDPDSLEVVYVSTIGILADHIALHDYNWYFQCKAYFPSSNTHFVAFEEKVYNGYANLYDLILMQKSVYSLGLQNEDGSKLVLNFALAYGFNESKVSLDF